MKAGILFLSVLVFSNCFAAGAGDKRPFQIPISEFVPIKDSGTGREYELFIKLPRNYSQDKKYPAVYLMDGAENFPIVAGVMDIPVVFGYMENMLLVAIS